MQSTVPGAARFHASLRHSLSPLGPSLFVTSRRFATTAVLAVNLVLLTLASALPAGAEPVGDPRLFARSSLPVGVYEKIRGTDSFLSAMPRATTIGIGKVVDGTGRFILLSLYDQEHPWDYHLYIFRAKDRSLYARLSLSSQMYRPPVIQFLRFGTNTYLAITHLSDAGSGLFRNVTTYYSLARGKVKRRLTIPERGELMVGAATPIEYSFSSSDHRAGNDLIARFHVDFYVFDPGRSPSPPSKPFISDSFHIIVVRNGLLQDRVVGNLKARLLVNLFMHYDFKGFNRLYAVRVRRLIETGRVSSRWVNAYHSTIEN